MESWLKNQCNFNYRSHSYKLSLTVISLFTGKKVARNETDPFLVSEDGIKHQQLKDDEKNVNNEEKKEDKIWRRLSLHSFRKKREKKQEEKSKPIIPAVLNTYDKQKKDHKKKKEWL
ncbi:hypothetical protein Zmor_013602 [Zophobas morio]|uniref:Uncharacterized protein n=1 Tax=Zophobas morio TaxID=2755281 RepID=A0AA38MF90_9CUCU|nr:hypothetical protein Zmor_013602 [Zophobas morio]